MKFQIKFIFLYKLFFINFSFFYFSSPSYSRNNLMTSSATIPYFNGNSPNHDGSQMWSTGGTTTPDEYNKISPLPAFQRIQTTSSTRPCPYSPMQSTFTTQVLIKTLWNIYIYLIYTIIGPNISLFFTEWSMG